MWSIRPVTEAAPQLRRTLQVSELTRYVKYVVESDEYLSQVSVHGEISNLSRSPGGHVYFTLKDESSQISCVLFRREALQQQAEVRELRHGAAAVVHGFFTVYEPRGTFQVYVERVQPAGAGAQFRRVEQLKEQLEREGLFSLERKRPLPTFPRRLALITSPGSQAYHDVLHRLRTQYPFVTVIDAGVSVQGEGAADEMAMALDIVNRLTDADVILLVRGGGAPEELAAFNEERLARAIFASRIPVVTGVGHETDYTIADFVADRRAATPSLAAALAVPDVGALAQQIAQMHGHIRHITQDRLRMQRRRLIELDRALLRSNPAARLRTQRQRSDDLLRSGRRGVEQQLRQKRARLRSLQAQLQTLDPLAILSRGYAVVTDPETGRVVSQVALARGGSRLTVRVSDGEFPVRVEGE
jgi:exodeoxyribonuclease VII large subunit